MLGRALPLYTPCLKTSENQGFSVIFCYFLLFYIRVFCYFLLFSVILYRVLYDIFEALLCLDSLPKKTTMMDLLESINLP